MKTILLLTVVLLAAGACSKHEEIGPPSPVKEEKAIHKGISLRVSNLEQIQHDSTSSIKHLYLLTYGLCTEEGGDCYLHGPAWGGNGVTAHQTPEDPNFGTFEITFPTSAHFVYIVGSNNPINFDDDYISTSNGTWRRPYARFPGNSDFIFYSTRISPNVSGPQDITLNRLASQLKFIIKDAIPDSTQSIELSFPNSAGFSFNELYAPNRYFFEAGYNQLINKSFSKNDWGEKGHTINYFLTSTVEDDGFEFDLKVKVKFCFPRKPLERTIRVKAYNNRRTVVQGNLFENPGARSSVLSNAGNWKMSFEKIN